MPDRQQMIQTLAHGFLQVVAALTERGVAAGEKIVLLALQGAAGAPIGAGCVAHHAGVDRVDLAIEIGEVPECRKSLSPRDAAPPRN